MRAPVFGEKKNRLQERAVAIEVDIKGFRWKLNQKKKKMEMRREEMEEKGRGKLFVNEKEIERK